MIVTLEQILALFVALGIGVAVALPFFRKRSHERESKEVSSPESPEGRLARLLMKKESLYSVIKEIEFDFKTGKLSESDYRELDRRYRREAIEVLRELDELEREPPVPDEEDEKEDEIEQGVRRARRVGMVRDEVERELSSALGVKGISD